MIQGLIVKWIFGAVFKAIQRKREWKKMEDYVKKPNDLDRKMKQVQRDLAKYGKYIEGLEKNVAILKKDTHPPIFSKRDKTSINKRLKKLEKKEK